MKLPKAIGLFSAGVALSGLAILLGDRPATAADCSISVGGGGHTETLRQNISRPTNVAFSVSSWDFLRSTSGFCHFVIYLDNGTYAMYGSGITDRIRFGNDGGNDGGSTRTRPRSVTFIPATGSCGITLGDNGRSQTFWGDSNKKIDRITGWDFIRQTWGGCRFTVYNGFGGQGRSYSVNSGVNNRIRVGWRIRSLNIGSSEW